MSNQIHSSRNGSVVRFGAFEFHPSAGELRKHGFKVRLQGKPLQLLQALLEHPGEVVAREKLRERLWAADTFVDFESGLNTAVNRLRLALGDSAEHPQYIGTLARTGYQFLAPVAEGPPAPLRTAVRKGNYAPWLAAGAILLVAAALLLWFRRAPAPLPVFHQITFRRFAVQAARFAPDGESVIYAAGDSIRNLQLYLANTLSPESRPLGFRGNALASVSRSDELALLNYDDPKQSGLVRVPLNGGAPLPLDRNVFCADWSPDGSAMAVARPGVRAATLEFPRGHTIFESPGWLSDVRISPSGKEVAFMEHPLRGDDEGNVMLVDATGAVRTLAAGWASADGLAWAPSGRDVWFTAARTGLTRSLYAVSLSGKLRQTGSFPGPLRLMDISRSGRILISRDEARMMMVGLLNGETKERDLSWFDYSHVADISDNGKVILFDETGEGGGAHHAVYIRRTDTSSVVRVGDGFAMALAPDSSAAVILPDTNQTRLIVAPLTPGQQRTISGQGIKYDWVTFFPDSRRLLVGGSLLGAPRRMFIQPRDGGKPVPIDTQAYLVRPAISPDGTMMAGVDSEDRLLLLPVAGGQPRVIAAGLDGRVVRFEKSGKSLVLQSDPIPAKLLRMDLATGRTTPWKEIAPFDTAGVNNIWPAQLSSDERTLVYSFHRILSELFVTDGLIASPTRK